MSLCYECYDYGRWLQPESNCVADSGMFEGDSRQFATCLVDIAVGNPICWPSFIQPTLCAKMIYKRRVQTTSCTTIVSGTLLCGHPSRVQSVVGAPKARHDSGWLFRDGILWWSLIWFSAAEQTTWRDSWESRGLRCLRFLGRGYGSLRSWWNADGPKTLLKSNSWIPQIGCHPAMFYKGYIYIYMFQGPSNHHFLLSMLDFGCVIIRVMFNYY